MKKILSLILCILTLFSLTACANREVKLSPITKDELVGKWNFQDTIDATFNEDGTCSIYEFQTEGEYTEGTYELTGDTLIKINVPGFWKGSLTKDNTLEVVINDMIMTFEKESAPLNITGVWKEQTGNEYTIEVNEDGTLGFYFGEEERGTTGVTYTYTYNSTDNSFLINASITMNIGLNKGKLRFNNVNFEKETE